MLLDLKDIDFSYLPGSAAEHKALSGVSMGLNQGDFVALIGSSGSGKTTLAQIMAGLLKPTRGKAAFMGQDILAGSALRARGQIGLVFQEPEKQLFEMTVADDVAFWPRSAGIESDEVLLRVEKALRAVGLDPGVYGGRSPFTLSGGEMRRAAIAGVLTMEPQLLILDEPTVGLDPRGRSELVNYIKALNLSGVAVVLISHDMDEVAELASRVVVLDQGRVIIDDAPKSVFSEHDLLRRIGLDLPQATKIANLIGKRGMSVDFSSLTIGELEESILATLGGRMD